MERYGWDKFAGGNDLMEWAKKHGLVLAHQSITAVRHKGPGFHRFSGSKLPDRVFYKNLCPDWLDKHNPSFLPGQLSINEYKRVNQNERPFWAQAFAERDVRVRTGKIERQILEATSVDRKVFRSIERESIIRKDGKQVLVERLLDQRGFCRRVTVIQPASIDGLLHLRQEDWASKGRWKVGPEVWWSDEDKTLARLLHEEGVWSDVFML